MRTIGNYTLGPLIGRGATSEVYAGTHALLGEPVAIKLLPPDLANEGAVQALVAEAVKTRAIVHPNVVRVLDAGQDPASKQGYLVLERVGGDSLQAHLGRSGRLDERDVRRLCAGIADGMQAAHAIGIVHCDLKPGNVMLADDQPKIVDFGIARSLGTSAATITQRRVGTPAYMAPEQLVAGLIAPCIDIWALGVILFEAATGRLPFQDFSGGRCPQLFETAPRARTLVAISPALDDLIARCLEHEARRRPASMEEIARALRGEIIGDERITQEVQPPASTGPLLLPTPTPTPTPTPARVGRARRAWMYAIGGAGIAAAIVVIALVLGASSSRGSTQEATQAEETPTEETATEETATEETPPAPAPATATAPPPAANAVAVEVRSKPAGAAIWIDGQPRGVTPARLEIPVPAAIELRRPGYRPARARAERAGVLTLELVRARRLSGAPRARPAGPPTRETLD